MLIAALLFGSSFVAVRFVESGVITKNWRKVPAVKKIDSTFDILIIYTMRPISGYFHDFLCVRFQLLKFIFSEKATKFCEIFTLFLTVCTVVKSKLKISQNFVAFSEYVNFIILVKYTDYDILLQSIFTLI